MSAATRTSCFVHRHLSLEEYGRYEYIMAVSHATGRFGRSIIFLKSDLDAFPAALEIIPAHTPLCIERRARGSQVPVTAEMEHEHQSR